MHLYNFGSPLSIVAASGFGKSKLFRPVGVSENRFLNPKTEPKTHKARCFGTKQAVFSHYTQATNEHLSLVKTLSMGGNLPLIWPVLKLF